MTSSERPRPIPDFDAMLPYHERFLRLMQPPPRGQWKKIPYSVGGEQKFLEIPFTEAEVALIIDARKATRELHRETQDPLEHELRVSVDRIFPTTFPRGNRPHLGDRSGVASSFLLIAQTAAAFLAGGGIGSEASVSAAAKLKTLPSDMIALSNPSSR